MRTLRLMTRAREFIEEIEVPEWPPMPDVLQVGARFFVRITDRAYAEATCRSVSG